jgi:D-sedoheptulose 7-phosphate isomerase
MKLLIENEIAAHLKVAETMSSLTNKVEIAAQLCIDTLQDGGKLLIFGNGGSAADAQHIAAELVGRYKINRKGIPAIALTTDTSTITAISNDFGYERIFERQLEALANEGDVLIGISTSGTSSNVIHGLKMATKIGCRSIGFSGSDGGEMNQICDTNIEVPSEDTPRIQEMHIVIGHIICHLIEQELIT